MLREVLKIGNRTYLQIAELRELLAALIQSTEVGLGLVVNYSVGSDVASLSKRLSAGFALEWPFPGVSSLMSLREYS
jgi:hypothetical protein